MTLFEIAGLIAIFFALLFASRFARREISKAEATGKWATVWWLIVISFAAVLVFGWS